MRAITHKPSKNALITLERAQTELNDNGFEHIGEVISLCLEHLREKKYDAKDPMAHGGSELEGVDHTYAGEKNGLDYRRTQIPGAPPQWFCSHTTNVFSTVTNKELLEELEYLHLKS